MPEQKPTRRGNIPMTKRERIDYIADLIAEGKSNKQIAFALRVTRGRIDTIVRVHHLRKEEQRY